MKIFQQFTVRRFHIQLCCFYIGINPINRDKHALAGFKWLWKQISSKGAENNFKRQWHLHLLTLRKLFSTRDNRLPVSTCLLLVACFPQLHSLPVSPRLLLATFFSSAWHWIPVFPRSTLAASFLALSTSCIFFKPLALVACFPAHSTSCETSSMFLL